MLGPYLSEREGELIQDGVLVEEQSIVAVVVVLVHSLPHVFGQLAVSHVLVHLVELGGAQVGGVEQVGGAQVGGAQVGGVQQVGGAQVGGVEQMGGAQVGGAKGSKAFIYATAVLVSCLVTQPLQAVQVCVHIPSRCTVGWGSPLHE